MATKQKDIGLRIKARREYLGFSHEYMAGKLSMSRGNYTRKEAGDVILTVDELSTIADTLRVSISYLYGDDDPIDIEDRDARMYYNGLPPNIKPAARAALKALYESNRIEDDAEVIGKRAE